MAAACQSGPGGAEPRAAAAVIKRSPGAGNGPRQRAATFQVLNVGYTLSTGPGVAATVSFVADGDRRVVIDPGMVADRARILEPLARLGLRPEDITDVVLSHYHPDNVMNVGLFGNANVHDHKAIYRADQWTDREAEGAELSPSIALIRTPGHGPDDISLLAGTAEGVVAVVGDLWWRPNGPANDPVAPDREVLRQSRRRVAALANLIVPGHGRPFRPDASTVF